MSGQLLDNGFTNPARGPSDNCGFPGEIKKCGHVRVPKLLCYFGLLWHGNVIGERLCLTPLTQRGRGREKSALRLKTGPSRRHHPADLGSVLRAKRGPE